MTPADRELIDTLQSVLRAVVIGLLAETGVDPSRLAVILAAQATNAKLSPTAVAMLQDLAEGLSVLDLMGNPRRRNKH